MSDGFTLLELMLVLFFCSVLLAVGNFFAPRWKASWAVNTAARDICFLVHKGKMTAIKNRSNVKLGLSSSGFYVFFDKDNDNVFSDGDRLIGRVVFADYPGNLRLWEKKSSLAGKKALAFNPRGFLAAKSKGGSIYLASMGRVRRVIISMNGAARIE